MLSLHEEFCAKSVGRGHSGGCEGRSGSEGGGGPWGGSGGWGGIDGGDGGKAGSGAGKACSAHTRIMSMLCPPLPIVQRRMGLSPSVSVTKTEDVQVQADSFPKPGKLTTRSAVPFTTSCKSRLQTLGSPHLSGEYRQLKVTVVVEGMVTDH